MTHDYTQRHWGHDYIFTPVDGGRGGRMMGWGSGLHKGDYLLLENKDGSTRYQIESIRYGLSIGSPRDMWRADVVFAPR